MAQRGCRPWRSALSRGTPEAVVRGRRPELVRGPLVGQSSQTCCLPWIFFHRRTPCAFAFAGNHFRMVAAAVAGSHRVMYRCLHMFIDTLRLQVCPADISWYPCHEYLQFGCSSVYAESSENESRPVVPWPFFSKVAEHAALHHACRKPIAEFMRGNRVCESAA